MRGNTIWWDHKRRKVFKEGLSLYGDGEKCSAIMSSFLVLLGLGSGV